MGWDQGLLRKYNTTGHFRLLNQLRGELKANPLPRPVEGEPIAALPRSRTLMRAIEARQGIRGRGRRQAAGRNGAGTIAATAAAPPANGFRDRLSAVQLR